ncbi:MAG: hypothetical protein KF881_13955 [Acidobacteria bacterium]|nr:hypothetical protein [Acidobacteriota bacterium]
MANRQLNGGARPADKKTRILSTATGRHSSNTKASFDEILAFLSSSVENRRARQVWEWERMRRQTARSE